MTPETALDHSDLPDSTNQAREAPPPSYREWLCSFAKDKDHVGSGDLSSSYAIHSVQRYVDRQFHVWEIGLTYTDRLVVRSGPVGPDGVSIEWGGWKTQHHVQVPKQPDVPRRKRTYSLYAALANINVSSIAIGVL